MATYRAAGSDLDWTIEQLIAQGEWVAVRLALYGRRRGECRAIAPTGRRVMMQEFDFWRVVDGRLHTIWSQADALGLRIQLREIAPSA